MKIFIPVAAVVALAGVAIVPSVTVNAQSSAQRPPVFARCAACHSIAPGQPNKSGPNLYGSYGRKAGTAADYAYSNALKSSKIVWNRATLSKFLANPGSIAKGTKMPPQPMSAADREAVITYMATLK